MQLNQGLASQNQQVKAAGAGGLAGLQQTGASGLAGNQQFGTGGLASLQTTGAGGLTGIQQQGAGALTGMQATGAGGLGNLGTSILSMLQQIMGSAAGGTAGLAGQYGAAAGASANAPNPLTGFMQYLAANPGAFNFGGNSPAPVNPGATLGSTGTSRRHRLRRMAKLQAIHITAQRRSHRAGNSLGMLPGTSTRLRV